MDKQNKDKILNIENYLSGNTNDREDSLLN